MISGSERRDLSCSSSCEVDMAVDMAAGGGVKVREVEVALLSLIHDLRLTSYMEDFLWPPRHGCSTCLMH